MVINVNIKMKLLISTGTSFYEFVFYSVGDALSLADHCNAVFGYCHNMSSH